MKNRYFVFCDKDILLERHDDESYTIPCSEVPPVEMSDDTHMLTVTLNDGSDVKAFYIQTPVVDNDKYEMCGLRQSYYKLPEADYLAAGKCSELLFWDRNTRYCGVCGNRMEMHTNISKRCAQCGREVWPQLATAIIVLIHRNDEVLLVRAKNFVRPFFGLVAGFVETGETLEDAVRREVLEETGLKIDNIRYFGSQPWPYPCGLMVGFNADYVRGEIKLQTEELAAGAWFSKDNLPQIPEKLSIARRLIDHWLESKKTLIEG